jgi:hypothetical protein
VDRWRCGRPESAAAVTVEGEQADDRVDEQDDESGNARLGPA